MDPGVLLTSCGLLRSARKDDSGILPNSTGARRRRAGFTLVEVIVVLVILAILAAIAIPALTGYIDKAKQTEIKTRAREFMTARQTLLSEAYADPQSTLSGVANSGFDSDPLADTGVLYIGDDQIAQTRKEGDFYNTRIMGGATDYYLYSMGKTSGSHIVDIDPSYAPSGVGHPAALMWELTQIPLINYGYAPHNVQTSTRGYCYIDNTFSLVAYVYVDPHAWTFNDDGGLNESYAYVYNMDYQDGDDLFPSGYNNSAKINLNAGYTLWKVTKKSGTNTNVTLHSLDN
jgi:type IV pilus assembly protein PilA